MTVPSNTRVIVCEIIGEAASHSSSILCMSLAVITGNKAGWYHLQL